MADESDLELKEELTRRFRDDVWPAFNDNMDHGKYFAEDGAIMPMLNETQFTREKVNAQLERTNKLLRPRIQEMDMVEVQRLTDTMCFTILRLRVTLNDGPLQWSKSLTIWKKVDGEWYLYRDMYSPCELANV